MPQFLMLLSAAFFVVSVFLSSSVQAKAPRVQNGTRVSDKAHQGGFCLSLQRRYIEILKQARAHAVPRQRRLFAHLISELDQTAALAPHCFRSKREKALIMQKDELIIKQRTSLLRIVTRKQVNTARRLRYAGWGLLAGGYAVQAGITTAVMVASRRSGGLPGYGWSFVPLVGMFIPLGSSVQGLGPATLQAYAATFVGLNQLVGLSLVVAGYTLPEARRRSRPAPPPLPAPKKNATAISIAP